jgi:hypothetical protein
MDCLVPTPTFVAMDVFTPTPPLPVLTFEMLRNASYHSDDWGDFTLTDGVYFRTPSAPTESPEIYSTRLMSDLVYGDMDFDGLIDVGAILSTQNGGTGHFVELALVLNKNGSPHNIGTVSLGDRVVVQTGYVQDGVLGVTMLVQGPNDPLCCPSQNETRRFRLDGNRLVSVP